MQPFTYIRTILDKPDSRQFIRFIFAGCFASAVYYFSAVSLDFFSIIPTMAANTIAYIVSVAASYTSQKLWAFKDTSSHRRAFPRFMASSLLGFCLNSTIVWLLLKVSIPFYIVSFVAMSVVAIFSYFFQRFFVFTKIN